MAYRRPCCIKFQGSLNYRPIYSRNIDDKVNDHSEDLEYGLWVSVSQKSFQDYSGNFQNPNHEAKYFGWLSNDIPEYEIREAVFLRRYLQEKTD